MKRTYWREIKKSFQSKNNQITLGVFAVVCVILAIAAPSDLDPGKDGGWYSVLPPLLAVTLALVTRKLIFSLVLAIVIGGFASSVAIEPSASNAVWGTVAGFTFIWKSVSDPFTLQILAFVALVMAMIALIVAAGGLHAVVQWCARFSEGRRSTKLMTAIMGVLIFFDDYANTMIVGSSMRPMTDRQRISREKLAFIVDATAAPVAGLAVISTWIGYEVGLFGEVAKQLAIPQDGYGMFFDAIGFRFYCILMLFFVFIGILTKKDFGPMARAENRAMKSGHVLASGSSPMTSDNFTAMHADQKAKQYKTTAIFPITALIVMFIGGIWIDGAGVELLSRSWTNIFSVSVWKQVVSNSENNVLILAYASLISLLIAILCSRTLAEKPWPKIWHAVARGLKASRLPILILIMAFSLKGTCDALYTGNFLVKTVGTVLSPLWFPALVFVLAGFTAFATGTSWGTMAILIPTAVPLAFQLDGGAYGIVTMITLGAVLDGAIAGDHCSPISDTTILSSIASSCDLIDHVKTQMPYTLTVAGIALVCGYIPAALGLPSLASIGMGIVLIGLTFKFFGRHTLRA